MSNTQTIHQTAQKVKATNPKATAEIVKVAKVAKVAKAEAIIDIVKPISQNEIAKKSLSKIVNIILNSNDQQAIQKLETLINKIKEYYNNESQDLVWSKSIKKLGIKNANKVKRAFIPLIQFISEVKALNQIKDIELKTKVVNYIYYNGILPQSFIESTQKNVQFYNDIEPKDILELA